MMEIELPCRMLGVVVRCPVLGSSELDTTSHLNLACFLRRLSPRTCRPYYTPYHHCAAMEDTKNDRDNDQSLMKYSTVRFLLPVPHPSPTQVYRSAGCPITTDTYRNVAHPLTNLSSDHTTISHVDHLFRLRSHSILVFLLLVHSNPRHQRTRIPPIRPWHIIPTVSMCHRVEDEHATMR